MDDDVELARTIFAAAATDLMDLLGAADPDELQRALISEEPERLASALRISVLELQALSAAICMNVNRVMAAG